MTSPASDCIFLFDTTHLAMWAEDVARERGIPAEVVAAPAEARAKCGLALRSAGEHCRALEEAMLIEGIHFRAHA
jgi:hypothetical protein